jgi:multicomponent Na+:H+ antiporter subunit G
MLNIIVIILLVCGLLFFTGGAIGIIRFPDFYSRLHPAGKLDTMGLLMTMTALALYTLNDLSFNSVLTSIKIFMIVIFVFITSPTATHAILDAGVRAGLLPWTKEEAKKDIRTTYVEITKDIDKEKKARKT